MSGAKLLDILQAIMLKIVDILAIIDVFSIVPDVSNLGRLQLLSRAVSN